jgi:hypothetical protein
VGNHPGLPGPDYAPDTGLRARHRITRRKRASMKLNGCGLTKT